jgi:NAD(P)H-dependent FMN reductase
VTVAPDYKNGYTGSLKNAFDYLAAGILRCKLIGIVTVSSGGFGGLDCSAVRSWPPASGRSSAS